MDVSEMLQRMRDPLGAPFFPPVFQVLLVVTWVLHIFFVTLALGSSCFSIYGFVQQGEYQLRLARVTARLTPNAVGLGIVTGIAPLLFVQTIYDPIWYASSTLTGFWSVTFIFIVMGGYSMAYLFYLKGSQDGRLLWSAVASLLLIFFAGWVMHVLASVSIRPDQWMQWYAPDGVIDTRGIQFHAFNLPRLVFLLPLQAGLSLAVVLQLFAWYFRQGEEPATWQPARSAMAAFNWGIRRLEDPDPDFLAWVAGLGRRLGMVVSLLYALFGVLWAITEGREFGIGLQIGLVLGLVGVALCAYFFTLREPATQALLTLGVWAGALLIVATIREVIRAVSLSRFGYSVSAYPYILDWGSVLIFSVTTVVGVLIIAYLAAVLYQSGLRREDEALPAGVERLGRIATGMLGAWFAFFLLVGLYTSLFLK